MTGRDDADGSGRVSGSSPAGGNLPAGGGPPGGRASRDTDPSRDAAVTRIPADGATLTSGGGPRDPAAPRHSNASPHPRDPAPAGAERRTLARALPGIVAGLLASLLLLFLLAPVGGLVARGGAEGLASLATDAELRGALLRTIVTATLATLAGVLLGTPLAWLLERRRFRGRALVAALVDLPLLVPHPVAGIALLLVLGRNSPAGAALLEMGLRVAGSTLGIVLAMLFVAAPLYVSAAREALSRVDPRYESVARTLGDTPWRAFRRVTLPLALRGFVAAAVVMWARAISEFGAIAVVAYNPTVASVLSYDRFATYGLREALPVAAVLVLLALVPLVLLRALRAADDREAA